jgi:hypothetical protein
VYANRRRIRGERGKRMQRRRGEKIERNFAHQFDTGGMDRLYVRGRENVHKKLLLQAAACNLALLMRSFYGAGKPRAAHDRVNEAAFGILALMAGIESLWPTYCALYSEQQDQNRQISRRLLFSHPRRISRFRHGLLVLLCHKLLN